MSEIKHNETNINNFRELMRKREELMKKKDRNNRKEILRQNVENWLDTVPDEYKHADLRLFTPNSLMEIKPYLLNNRLPQRLLVYGSSTDKELFVYAILKFAISKGIITPGHIRWAGVYEGSEAVMGGFQKQAWRDNFFDENSDVFIIKGLSRQYAELGMRGTNKFLGQFAQFANENHKSAIMIYDTNLKEEKVINNNGRWVPYIVNDNNIIVTLLTRKRTLIHLGHNSLRNPEH